MIYLPDGSTYMPQQPKSSGYPSAKVYDHTRFFAGEVLKFGVVSDTHFGSKMERPEELKQAYQVFAEEGIQVVYHAGDLTSGCKVYAGQENETLVWGMNEQADHLAELYPRVPGVVTYFILGNHDASYLKLSGSDVGTAIQQRRPDIVYLDQIQGKIQLAPGVTVMLWHPGGAGSYALSYKGQKLINSLEGGTKPQIIISGHYHCDFYMMYRNIHFLQAGCFERQTLWLKAGGLQPSCSAWLVTCRAESGSVIRFQPELIKFF